MCFQTLICPNRLWFMANTAEHNTPYPMVIALVNSFNTFLDNGKQKKRNHLKENMSNITTKYN